MILASWVPLLAGTSAGHLPWRWLVLWAAVYVAVVLVNRLRMLAAHHFGTELWAPLGSRYHALHHLFPAIPFHNPRRACN